ncbi:efflux RND transporter periplasmic adaptor subunit [Patescibacteria group bacterium]|nr:efflux RND transporter periplasmic adaptor subunit [Patescibacteria group bacterium]
MLNKIKEIWKKQSKIKKILIILILGLILYLIFKPKTNDTSLVYKYSNVQKGEVIQVVSETGEVTTSNKAEISTTINGVVTEVYVDNGDSVRRGDKLFYVTSDATEEERAQAYSSYLSAKNSLAAAQVKLNTLESSMWAVHETFESKALDTELSVDDPVFIQTQRDWLAGEATYINQKDVISQNQVALNSAWLNYQATIDGPVKATIDGKVANLAIAKGQAAIATETALIIKTESPITVKIAINENDIGTVAPGQTAQIGIDALPDTNLVGTVDRVDEFATISSDVAVYYVYLTVNEGSDRVLPGMTAQVDITTQQKSDILVVPNTAIKPYQGEKAVQIMDEKTNTVIYQPIKIGLSGDINTEVISGLSEGEKIIISSTSSTSKSGGLFSPPGGN